MKPPADLDAQKREGVAKKPLVLMSLEDETGLLCVDVLELPGEGYGFQEFRRDPEDPHGWRPTGLAHDCVLISCDLALKAAHKSVTWLEYAGMKPSTPDFSKR